MPRRSGLLALALVLGGLTGCVERSLLIRSEPSGANVFVDGKRVGTTPARVPFDHYGTREVMVRMEESAEMRGERALAPQTRLVEVSAPWYQWFPIDLLSEFVWPGTIRDERVLDFALEPHDAETIRTRFEDRARAQGIRMPLDPRPEEPEATPPGDDTSSEGPDDDREPRA